MDTISPLEFIKVKTTAPPLPFLGPGEQIQLQTERLILRPFSQNDLHGLHKLRTQMEVMKWTPRQAIDDSIEKTQAFLNAKMAANGIQGLGFVICLASTGEVIGTGGTHSRTGRLGWPELGYMLRKEFWGQGYASEFLSAFIEYWWSLPRTGEEIDVERASILAGEKNGSLVTECLAAVTDVDNIGSQKVMEKRGFVRVKKSSLAFEGRGEVPFYGYVLRRPHVE
ncbi:hypothetical protein VHEMI06801 [[Torrubiella] hemipterigena]|uniref:N-acetyltransferase domain-containing protein n=1 Tax=[Torrubiella] hemipterigena TaxID=1531966 RepID=A0A0A1TKB1_9HYPO|nr:hypothetical protein VHEMI06801 [[Torrubiella] hemipterigena]